MNYLKHGDYYYCKKSRMLEYLVQHGFEPYRVTRDYDNPKFRVWVFHNSAELEVVIEKYFEQLAIKNQNK